MQDFALPRGAPGVARSPSRWFMPNPSRPRAPAWMAVRRETPGCDRAPERSMVGAHSVRSFQRQAACLQKRFLHLNIVLAGKIACLLPADDPGHVGRGVDVAGVLWDADVLIALVVLSPRSGQGDPNGG